MRSLVISGRACARQIGTDSPPDLPRYPRDERLTPRWLRNFARERRRELLELEQKDCGADAKPSAARRQAYELPKNYTPVNFIVGSEDEESGKRYRAKIYIERFSRPPRPPPPASLLMRSQGPAAPNGVTLKKRRATEIIPDNHHYMQRPAQSSTQYRQRDATVAAARDGRSL